MSHERVYVYIYIYIYRERDISTYIRAYVIYIYTYIYIYIYICIVMLSLCVPCSSGRGPVFLQLGSDAYLCWRNFGKWWDGHVCVDRGICSVCRWRRICHVLHNSESSVGRQPIFTEDGYLVDQSHYAHCRKHLLYIVV